MKDKSKYSAASKKRWASVPPLERSRRMSELAKIKHAKMTREERVRQAYKMLLAKKK